MKPYRVRLAPPVVGAFGRAGNVSTGASNEKCTVCVPTVTPTVRANVCPILVPAAVLQTIVVSEFHEVVAHRVTPTRGRGVVSSNPNWLP